MNDRLTGRRELLLHVLPACSFCLGLSQLANAEVQKSPFVALAERVAEKADMSYEELFKFKYANIISILKNLSDQIGGDKFIKLLKKAAGEVATREAEAELKTEPKRDLASYIADLKKPGPIYEHSLTFEFIKDTEKEAEARITECLWAKTFRQANAADIGYAMICNPDSAYLKAYNPKIKLDRPKLLMRGDNECRFIFTMRA